MTERERILLIARSFDFADVVIRAAIWVGGFYFCRILPLPNLRVRNGHGDAPQCVSCLSTTIWRRLWLIAVAALAYAAAQRRLRLKKTEEMQGYIRELERRIDPSRTSSGLTPTGQPHTEAAHRRRNNPLIGWNSFSLSLCGVWLPLGPRQRLVVDTLRQNLFERRDQLFLIAANGHLSFDSEEYRALRERLNLLIRYCDAATWPHLFAVVLVDRSRPVRRNEILELAGQFPMQMWQRV